MTNKIKNEWCHLIQYLVLLQKNFKYPFAWNLLSIFRYYALVHPLSSLKIHSKSRTRVIICVTWILAAILAGPYTFCKSYPFSIFSDLGSVTRQICTDRFDDIDLAIYGPDLTTVGSFRKGFFLFLFFTVYLLPLVTIVMTSIKIAQCLLQPISESDGGVKYQTRIGRKREENKRKVRRTLGIENWSTTSEVYTTHYCSDPFQPPPPKF